MTDAHGIKITVYKLRNFLKNKIGLRLLTNQDGYVAEEKIEEANRLVVEMCKDCREEIGRNLADLSAAWAEMQKMPDNDARKEQAVRVFTLAHEIKDIASLCGYHLAAYFAESLRDYVAETALSLKNQRIIIQAHIDAMSVVHKNNIRDDGGAAAEELKKMVKVAIDKYK